jgi:hypothetical protein
MALRADRMTRIALALALALALLGLLVLQGTETAIATGRRLGFQQGRAQGGIRVVTLVPGLPAERGGLRVGDIIVAIDGHPVSRDLDYLRAATGYHRGVPARFYVLRNGQPVHLELVPGVDFPYLHFVINLLTVVCFLGLGVLALSKGLRDLRARLLFGFAAAVALELALPTNSIGNASVRMVSVCCWYLFTGLQIGISLHMASLIPERQEWLRERSWVVPLYYVVGIALGLVSCLTYVAEQLLGLRLLPWALEQTDALLQDYVLPLWAAGVCLLLVRQALRYPQPTGRHQAGLVLSACIPWFLTVATQSLFDRLERPMPAWLDLVQLVVVLFYPVALFVAVYLYNLFDIELVVRRSLIYTTLSGALVVVFYGLLGGVWAISPRPLHASAWAVAFAMLLLGLLFAPLRRFAHRLIDRRFFPERDEMRQRLISLAGELPALGKLPRMGEELVRSLTEIFGSRSAILFIATPETGLAHAARAPRRPRHRSDQAQHPPGLLGGVGAAQPDAQPPSAGARRPWPGGATALSGPPDRRPAGQRQAQRPQLSRRGAGSLDLARAPHRHGVRERSPVRIGDLREPDRPAPS